MRLLVAASLLFVGCGPSPAPGESVDEVCRVENDGRDVHVAGYLVPPVITTPCEQSCSLYLARDRSTQDGVFVHFAVGTGPNTMDAVAFGDGSPGFEGEVRRVDLSDFRVRDGQGGTHSIGDAVRVRGRVSVARNGERIDCNMRAETIEPLR